MAAFLKATSRAEKAEAEASGTWAAQRLRPCSRHCASRHPRLGGTWVGYRRAEEALEGLRDTGEAAMRSSSSDCLYSWNLYRIIRTGARKERALAVGLSRGVCQEGLGSDEEETARETARARLQEATKTTRKARRPCGVTGCSLLH